MIPLGPHADFIIAAYAVALIVLVALIAWVSLDHRAQRRLLAELEQHGTKRRSTTPGSPLSRGRTGG